MYILIALIIGLLIGFIRKGSIGAIFSHPYKLWYLGVFGVVLMILLHYYYLIEPAFPNLLTIIPVINFISYLCILLTLVFNLDDIYSILIAIGFTLDFIVTFINGGYMPVADSVLQIMPLYSDLAQSIYTSTNGVYTVLDATQTLFPFLGIILPIPLIPNLFANLGSVTGLSLGGAFILVGLIGLVQSAMCQETASERVSSFMESAPEENKPIIEANQNRQRPVFDSKTEELFFEENALPKNKLDRIFEDDYIEPTRNIHSVTQLKPIAEPTGEVDIEGLDSIENLTESIGTGVINTREVNNKINRPSGTGFFTSNYLNEKSNTDSFLNTGDIFDTGSVDEEPKEEKVAKPEKKEVKKEKPTKLIETPVFKPKATSIKKAEEKAITPQPTTNVSIEEVEDEPKEATKELFTTKDFFLDPKQFKQLMDTVNDEEFKKNLEEKYKQVHKEEETPEIVTDFVETPSNVVEPVLDVTDTTTDINESVTTNEEVVTGINEIEPETKETQQEDLIEEVVEIPKLEEVIEQPVLVDIEPEEEELTLADIVPSPSLIFTTNYVEEPSETEEELQVTEVPETVAVETEEVVEPIEQATAQELSVDEIKEPEVEENNMELEEKSIDTLDEEVIPIQDEADGVQEVLDDLLTNLIDEPKEEKEVDKSIELISESINENAIDTLLETINKDEELTEKVEESEIPKPIVDIKREPKRGEFIQVDGTGYFVNKAYKEEKENMDRAEEDMLNVWAQISQENNARKLNRRRQASANYQTSNPYQEELERTRKRKEQEEALLRKEKEEQERKAASIVNETSQPVKATNPSEMTDEERRAAGYEYITIEVSGQKLSFWQKTK